MDPKSRATLMQLVDKALVGPAGQIELDRARSALLEMLAARRHRDASTETIFRLFIEIAVWKTFGSLGLAISRSILQAGVLDEAARREAEMFRQTRSAQNV